MKKCMYLLLISLQVLMSACATKSVFKGTSELCGMITSQNNKPVAGYVVSLNGKERAVSNEAGLFTIPNVPLGAVVISGSKVGWQNFCIEQLFSSVNELFCVQVKCVDDVLVEIEAALDCNDSYKALSLLSTIENSEEKYEEIKLYKSLVLFKKELYSQSFDSFNKMSELSKHSTALVTYGMILQEKKMEETNEDEEKTN